MLQQIVQYGYVPFMLLGVTTAAGLAAAAGNDVAVVVMVVLAVAISFVVERILPYRPEWNESLDDAGRDGVHALVNECLVLASVAAVPMVAALDPLPRSWPDSVPFAGQVVASVLVADLGITVVHMASHKIGWMWRLHAVHHSVRRCYGFNGLMKHPVHEAIEMTAGVLPLVMLGIPSRVATTLAVCVAVQLLLQHSNVDYRVGPLRRVLALNEGHRFHHLKWAGIGDVNFGLFTLVWDHAFRTFSFDADRVFSSDDLGMAAKPDYPTAYLAQLVEPFRASGRCAPELTAVTSSAGSSTGTGNDL